MFLRHLPLLLVLSSPSSAVGMQQPGSPSTNPPPSAPSTPGGAYYNLDRFADADRTARADLAADPNHTAPRLHKLLGETLYRRGDSAGALLRFRASIEYAGDAPDVSTVKERAAMCERLARVFQKK
jgi:hypothetical protein